MNSIDAALIWAKRLVGEPLTAEETTKLSAYDLRYGLVRALYMEKMKADGKNIRDFHFTPGDKFLEVPVLDVLNGLLEATRQIESGESKPLDFGDSSWKKAVD